MSDTREDQDEDWFSRTCVGRCVGARKRMYGRGYRERARGQKVRCRGIEQRSPLRVQWYDGREWAKVCVSIYANACVGWITSSYIESRGEFVRVQIGPADARFLEKYVIRSGEKKYFVIK